MAKRRVVVTGMGMISSLAHNVEDTWKALLAGQSGVKRIDFLDDMEKYASQISGSVRDFDPGDLINVKDRRKMDLFIQYGIVAADQALKDAGITGELPDAERCGVALGSGVGGLPMIEKSRDIILQGGPRKLSPMFIPGVIINMLPGHVSMRAGLKGPNFSVVTACTTGTHNIGLAARAIAYGDADLMVVGGAENATCQLGVGGFSAMRALSTRNDEPERASRPWDVDRDGFVLGDGAGVLVIEDYERAKKRGAKIYAELVGYGMTGDAHHMTMPETGGQARAMQLALDDAGLTPDSIDYINAHGTSTLAGDVSELNAIKQVCGEHAYNLSVSSTKSMLGHLLGAAGAVEAIFSILAIRDQIAPPTINLDNPDEGCDLDLVPHTAKKRDIKVALSNSFGFGGTNGSVIFKAFEDTV